MIYADAHCHLTNDQLKIQIDDLLTQCKTKNLELFFQGGIEPEEWVLQLELHRKYPSIQPILGLHPMWVATQTTETVNLAFEKLAPLVSQALGIGEVGLDLRSDYVGNMDIQLEALQNQVELAHFTKLPIVWHLVRCFDFVSKNPFVSEWFQSGGFVHAFNGSWVKAQFYLNHGLSLSIGGAVTYPSNHSLHEVAKKIPIDRLLLETDSPDQKNYKDNSELNFPYQIWETAQVVGDLRGMSAEDVLRASTENLKKMFKIC